jgi:hypothetical protein
MVQELLNIKEFCQRKFKKIKTKKFNDIGAKSWSYWKALDDLRFLRDNFTNFKPRRWGRS